MDPYGSGSETLISIYIGFQTVKNTIRGGQANFCPFPFHDRMRGHNSSTPGYGSFYVIQKFVMNISDNLTAYVYNGVDLISNFYNNNIQFIQDIIRKKRYITCREL